MEIRKYQGQIKETVVAPMIYFMEVGEGDCEYSKKDVEKCEEMLLDYLTELSKITNPNEKVIMNLVKDLVLALNDLNEECGYELIETEAREAIWEIIQTAAIDCGLVTDADDITEEWREW